MKKYEFVGFNSQPETSDSTDTSEEKSFLDFVEGEDYSDSKWRKKAKKALKVGKKHNKKIKKLSSKHKDLEKEVSALKADIKVLKKSAYNNKLAELVNSDNITERKHLANELYKMEV